MTSHSELRGGLCVADDAIRFAVDLERRGHVLKVDGAALKISDGARLTEAERAAVTRWRWHLLAIAAYQA